MPVGIHRVARLMRQDGLKVFTRKGYRQTTQSNHKRLVTPNIRGREFTAAGPNLTWLADITFVSTDQRWSYLAIVLDLYARRVVDWSMSDRLTDQLTSDALKMALKRCWLAGPGEMAEQDELFAFIGHKKTKPSHDDGRSGNTMFSGYSGWSAVRPEDRATDGRLGPRGTISQRPVSFV